MGILWLGGHSYYSGCVCIWYWNNSLCGAGMTINQYAPHTFIFFIMLNIAAFTLLAWALMRRYWQHVETLAIAIPMFLIGLASQLVH